MGLDEAEKAVGFDNADGIEVLESLEESTGGFVVKDDIERVICSNISTLFGRSLFEKQWQQLEYNGHALSRDEALALIHDFKDLLIAIFGKKIALHVTADLVKYLDPMIIHEVYLIDNSGCLIAHTPDLKSSTLDVDLICGMFTAIQDFVQISFSEHQSLPLKKLRIGDKKISISHGENVYLALVYSGHMIRGDHEMIEGFLSDLESSYHLESWETAVPGLFEIGDKIKELFSDDQDDPRWKEQGVI